MPSAYFEQSSHDTKRPHKNSFDPVAVHNSGASLSSVRVLLREKYGAESWPAILFLALVTALFLVPALILHWEVSNHQRKANFQGEMGLCARALWSNALFAAAYFSYHVHHTHRPLPTRRDSTPQNCVNWRRAKSVALSSEVSGSGSRCRQILHGRRSTTCLRGSRPRKFHRLSRLSCRSKSRLLGLDSEGGRRGHLKGARDC